MKVPEVTLGEEVAGNIKWLGGRETLDAGFFVWGIADGAVQLAIAIIGCVNGLERNKLRQVRRKIKRVFLLHQEGLWMHSISYNVPDRDFTIHQGPVNAD
jgi:hypothetical protein